MHLLSAVKEHLTGMGHGGTLNKVRNQEAMFERSAAKFLLKNKPVTSIRTVALTQAVHTDYPDYALPDDFGTLIDLMPMDNRGAWDRAYRTKAGEFDLRRAQDDKVVSIEGSEGEKMLRVNWKGTQPKVLNRMDSLTDNGTWSAVATASNVSLDEVVKRLGNGSIKFDAAASGDGIDNDDMDVLDLSDDEDVSEVLVDFYIKNAADLANFNSITVIWGENLTTKYWTGTAQTTQADGTAFRVGFNTVRIPWNTATPTGAADAALVDSLKITVNIDAAIAGIRIDNVRFSRGRAFDLKHYSKYLFMNPDTRVWLSRPESDDSLVIVDNDGLPLFLMECLVDMAHQMEGTDSAFDIEFAKGELKELFPHFRAENPNQSKKVISRTTRGPRWARGRR
jgi:hypothetical protein